MRVASLLACVIVVEIYFGSAIDPAISTVDASGTHWERRNEKRSKSVDLFSLLATDGFGGSARAKLPCETNACLWANCMGFMSCYGVVLLGEDFVLLYIF